MQDSFRHGPANNDCLGTGSRMQGGAPDLRRPDPDKRAGNLIRDYWGTAAIQ